MRRLVCILISLCLLLTGCMQSGGSYVPTGDALYQEGTTTPTGNADGTEQQMKLAFLEELGLNPYKVANFNNRLIMGLMYQGLFSVDRDYNVEPVLCKNYARSRDMRTYIFYLEESAAFADGTPLTAQDVAASLQAAWENNVYIGRFGNFKKITITADGGIRIDLKTAYSDLPVLLDVPIVKASEVESDYPTGTGAYRISEGIAGRGLLRATDWWCDADLQVTATYIPLISAESNEDIRNGFELDNVGVVCTDPGSTAYVDYRGDYEIWECQNGIFLYLACNENSEVFSIPEIRQALSAAIERGSIVESCYDGFATAAVLPALPGSPYYSERLAARYTYDPEQLRQAVAGAELEDNHIVILVHKTDSTRVLAARAIAQMLNDCGLKAEVQALDGSRYSDAVYWHSFDLHLVETMMSPNMDLSPFYNGETLLSRAGLEDANILALCQNALANIGNYESLHRAVQEDAMLCPILFRSYAVYAQRGLLTDIEPARDAVLHYSLGKTMEGILLDTVVDNSDIDEEDE